MKKKSIIDRNPVLRGLEKAGEIVGKVSEKTDIGRAFHPDPKVRQKFQEEKRSEGAAGMAMEAGMQAGVLKNVGGINWSVVGTKTQRGVIRMISPAKNPRQQAEVLDVFTGSRKSSGGIIGSWNIHRAEAARKLTEHVGDKRFAKAILNKLMGKGL